MSLSETHKDALELCTYCPSLCLHTCPVSTVEARQTVSPWGKMSLARYATKGQVDRTHALVETLYKCTGCGACTEWCRHDVDVSGVLRAARQEAVGQGVIPFAVEIFAPTPSNEIEAVDVARACERYHAEPRVLFFPGSAGLHKAPDAIGVLWELCARLEEDDLAMGVGSTRDSGYALWTSGHDAEFRAHAAEVKSQLDRSDRVIVWSPQDLKVFQEVYPQIGLAIDADLLSLVNYLVPMLSGPPCDD